MDINKIRSERISKNATAKVLLDHFPTIYTEEPLNYEQENPLDLEMHAGALCLYATTLFTQIHETDTDKIKCECGERKQALRKMFLKIPKYQKYTDEQLEAKVNETILKNIRNSFAHGNFEISYDIYTKKLNFVLWPTLKGLEENKPIIISKDTLFDLNRKYISNLGFKYEFMLNKFSSKENIDNIYSEGFKSLGIPVAMIKLAENYIDKKIKYQEKYHPKEDRFSGICYPLLVSQMTYEQDDYYNIYNKESNIFGILSHIRNSLAHNWTKFDAKSFEITHSDEKDYSSTTPISKSISMLHLIKDLKNLVLYLQKRSGKNDPEATNKTKEFFDELFVAGEYEKCLKDEQEDNQDDSESEC